LDEQDISKVSLGQTAQVKVEALKGQIFEAEVTKIAISGTNNGGSSKFTVVLTMDMAENMIAGMSATASLPLQTKTDVLTIPVAALSEDRARTVVYTALDEKTGEPVNPVEVTVGLSDGEKAEVISGLENGDTVYYAYYDTLELSHDVESPSFSFGR
jgi:HlyD family secretion protein